MRILDINGTDVTTPDLSLGRLIPEIITIHHTAIEGITEQGHYETIAEYPNGGRDVVWIVDVPGREAKQAWQEAEEILRYTLFTENELAQIESAKTAATAQDDTDAMLIDHEYRLLLLELGLNESEV